VLVATGFANAGDGKFGSMSIFDKWRQNHCAKCAESCEPSCIPLRTIPSPCLFRAEVGSPTMLPGKPLPPIALVRAVPPSIELVAAHPPAIPLVRATPPPVELVGAVPPRLDMFRREPAPVKSAPPIKIPSVAIFQVAQPPKPCCPPPTCATCTSFGGR
jgi:hypothetical protein